MADRYFIKHRDKVKGPFRVEELRAMRASDNLHATFLISRSQTGPWDRLGDVYTSILENKNTPRPKTREDSSPQSAESSTSNAQPNTMDPRIASQILKAAVSSVKTNHVASGDTPSRPADSPKANYKPTIVGVEKVSLWILLPLFLCVDSLAGLVFAASGSGDLQIQKMIGTISILTLAVSFTCVLSMFLGITFYICSDCQGKLPSKTVRTCLHCRARFDAGDTENSDA